MGDEEDSVHPADLLLERGLTAREEEGTAAPATHDADAAPSKPRKRKRAEQSPLPAAEGLDGVRADADVAAPEDDAEGLDIGAGASNGTGAANQADKKASVTQSTQKSKRPQPAKKKKRSDNGGSAGNGLVEGSTPSQGRRDAKRKSPPGFEPLQKSAKGKSPPGVEPLTDTAPPNGSADAAAAAPKRIPQGKIALDDSQTPVAWEMIRLLRAPRYFDGEDEDYEAAAMRCFHCGGTGHMARDCANEGKERPCTLCAQFHGSVRCPNTLCHNCNRPGHNRKDCPKMGNVPRAACLRCGRTDCPGASNDVARSAGACTFPYDAKELAMVRCAVCQRWGHLCCKAATAPPLKPSCANCGMKGHTWESCDKMLQSSVEGEMRSIQSRNFQFTATSSVHSRLGASAYGRAASGSYVERVVSYGSPPGQYTAPVHAQYNASTSYAYPANYQANQYGVPPSRHGQYQYDNGYGAASGQYTAGQYGVPQHAQRQYSVPQPMGQYGVPQGYRVGGGGGHQGGYRGSQSAWSPNGGGNGYNGRYAPDEGYDELEAARPHKHKRFR